MNNQRSATPSELFWPVETVSNIRPEDHFILLGREQELSDLINLCLKDENRTISLLGPGGAGKTRLAVETARSLVGQFEHGCWLVSLSAVRDPLHIYQAACAALQIPPSSSERWQSQLAHYLAGKQMLLVLDGVEHLLPGAVNIITEIAGCSPGLKIFTTSRELTNIPGEQVYRLRGLSYPTGGSSGAPDTYGALRLFAEHLRRTGNPFRESDLEAALRVCRLVDGMPLALILAAGWGRVMSCAGIAEELERGTQLARLPGGTVPGQHDSMALVFDGSLERLSEAERSALSRLAVFPGPFDRPAAAQVAGAGLEILAGLLDKSCLERQGEHAYRINGLLRQHVLKKLEATGGLAGARDAHLEYFRQVAEQAEPELYGQAQRAWGDRLDAQYRDLLAAMEWGLETNGALDHLRRAENGVRLAQGLWYYWHLRWGWKEGRQWYRRCLALPLDRLAVIVQVRAYAYAAIFESVAGDWPQAIAWADEALRLAQLHGTEEGLALALLRKGGVLRMKDRPQGKALIEQALAIYRRLNQTFYICAALFYLGQESEDASAAQAYYNECLALALKTGNLRYVAFASFNLGGAACQRGDLIESRLYHEKSYAAAAAMNDQGARFAATRLLGRDCLLLNDLETARGYLQESWQIARNTGDPLVIALTHQNDGLLCLAAGEIKEAAHSYQQSLAILNLEYRESPLIVETYHGLALVEVAQEQYKTAADYLRKALVRCLENPAGTTLFDRLDVLSTAAALEAAIGQPARAVMLFSAAAAGLSAGGYRLHPPAQALSDNWLARARGMLNQKQFTRAWQRGKALDANEAIRLALNPATAENAIDPQPPGKDIPGGLSAREVDVLRLVAQGLTDAQVAEKLVLSPRTVNAHLTSIYNKLGVSTRTAAARFAVEHGLAID